MTTKYLDNSSSALLSTEIGTLDEQVPAVSETARDFDFHAVHNGEACIESFRPEDAYTPNAFRFTIAMLCTIYNVAERTMRDNIDSLLEDEEIAYCDISQYAIPGGNNRTYETTLYNLTVLNRLGMCCFRKNKEAKKVRDKFNDVLVKHETGVTQPEMSDAEIMSRALEIAHRTLALREERIKALQAERDEAIRTKTQYQSNLAAQMSGRVGGLTSALNRVKLENDLLTTENSRLRQDYVENKDFCKQLRAQKLVVYVEKTLRDKCSKALQELSSLMEIPRLEWKEFSEHAGKEVPRYAYHKDVCAELKQRIIDNPKYLRRF